MTALAPGALNSITDIRGIVVGNAQDDALRSGATVVLGDAPFTAGLHIMGGAPGTRETQLLAPDRLVQQVDALVLSGGSAFGLAAADGVAAGLREDGRGFEAAGHRVPIVPAAILFDLANGGDKGWSDNPYTALGRHAYETASTDVPLGPFGAGRGATTADLVGGLGTASTVLPSGHSVGALVAVNAIGSAVASDQGHFHAAPYEWQREFGGKGISTRSSDWLPPTKVNPQATTIAVVATDACLDQSGCTRLATAAHDGMARALVPSHTLFDGDLVFGLATGENPLGDPVLDALALGHIASLTLARAIARAVYHGQSDVGGLPSWTDRFGQAGTVS